MRRAGQQHDDVFAAIELSAEPLTWGRAIRIWKDGGAVENVGLLGIVGSHLPTAIGKALFQASQDFRIAPQTQAQRFANRLAGKIVFRGSEAAAEDQNVGT